MRRSPASRSQRRSAASEPAADRRPRVGPVHPTLAPAGTVLAVLAAMAAAGAAVTVPLWSAAYPAAGAPAGAVPRVLASGAAQDAGSPRLVVVIADLHLGLGRDEAGVWRRGEDFRWADEFGRFLEALDAEGGGATDLVLNGDTFDLTRPADAGCAHDDPALGCTEPEALARLDRVLAAHAGAVDALAAFAASGANRVVLVPGEHDAALLFPAARRLVEGALGEPEGRVEVASDGYWQSDDGQIHVEHGHQIGRAHV